jgi:hypothetical protein
MRAAAVRPPIVLPVVPPLASVSSVKPEPVLACALVPLALVPMKLPSIVLPPPVSRRIPSPPVTWPLIVTDCQPLIARPRTVLLPAVIVNPFMAVPASCPFRSISRTALSPLASVFCWDPGCV